MLLVPHTIVGVAVAIVVKQPALALPLVLLSHFVLDCIPHWDPLVEKLRTEEFSGVWRETFLFILIDFLIALDLGLFFVWQALPDTVLATVIFLSAFLANVPDALLIPQVFFGKRWSWAVVYGQLHSRLQTRLSLPWGLLTQAAVVAIGLLLAFSR